MSNPLKYSTSTPTGALRHDTLGAGVASIQYDENWNSGATPNSLTAYYLIYEPVDGTSVRIYAPSNAAELIKLQQSKGGSATTEAGALLYLSNNGYYPANKILDNVVTDDLELLLDSRTATSYPRSGADILDLSGGGKNGYLYNGVAFGENSEALVFDGTDDYVLTTSNVTITGDQSIETFIKFDTLETFLQGLISNHDYVNTSNFGINQVQTNKIGISIGYTNGSREYNNKYSTTAVGTIRFYHIVMTFNLSANQCKLYIDGELDSTFNLSNTVKYTSRPMVLGRWDYQYTNYYFDGEITMSKYYSKTLSSAEVLQNYYQGPIVTDTLQWAIDASNIISFNPGTTAAFTLINTSNAVNGDGVLTNGVAFSDVGNGAWDFDGVDDYINFASLPSAMDPGTDGAFSFGGWIETSNESGFQKWIRLSNYYFYLNTGSTYIRIYYGGTPIDLSVTFSHGEWVHWFAVVDRPNNILRIYKNGAQVAINTSATATGGMGTSVGMIGDTAGEQLKGLVGPVHYYKKALTAAEVEQNYNANVKKFT